MKKQSYAIIAILMAMILAVFTIGGCKLTDESEAPNNTSAPVSTDAAAPTQNDDPNVTDEPDATDEPNYTPWPENVTYTGSSVVMRCDDVELNMYDFGQGFYNSQYIQYYMYGMMQPDQYCSMVIDELSTLIYLVSEAKANGLELTEDELIEIDSTIDEHVVQLLKSYEEQVADDVADKAAQAKADFESDLAEDDLDFDSFITLAKNNLKLHTLAEKYYNTLLESVKASDDEVTAYIRDNIDAAKELSMLDFSDQMNAYFEGSGPYPLYIIDDCFSVNHIYLAFETSEDGTEYLTESRKEDEAAVEAKLPELEDFNAFMEYEKTIGEDPGMDEGSPYVENGYLIHPDLIDSYFTGFVYAAMNLHEGVWRAPVDAQSTPAPDQELTYFELKDGEKVVKVCTESGVHYIIVNKEYKRGDVEYEIGDEIWESWRTAASEEAMNGLYEQLINEWHEKYTIDVDRATIMAKYNSAQNDPEEDSGN